MLRTQRQVKGRDLGAQVAERLARELFSGRTKPGNLLPKETELVESFGVSRVSVRAGLQTLAALGIVRRYAGQGTIVAVDSFRRGGRTLVLSGMIGLVVQHLGRFRDLVPLIQALSSVLARRFGAREVPRIIAQAYTALEVLIEEGWVKAARDESKHRLRLETPEDGPLIHNNRDPAPEA